jgi:hypothetical protein
VNIKEQMIRDLRTDALLVPHRGKRYGSYGVSVLIMLIGLVSFDLGMFRISTMCALLLALGIGWYLTKAYRYIQNIHNKENEQG